MSLTPNERQDLVHIRRDPLEFFARMPDRLGDYEIVAKDEWKPGDHTNYASGFVIAQSVSSGRYSTHQVLRVDDTGEFGEYEYRLVDGHYDFDSFDEANGDYVQRTGHSTQPRPMFRPDHPDSES